MTKAEVLKLSTFGKRVAEEEIDALAEYFVRTALYEQILAGDVDVIYGAKGSGKSAIYFSLLKADNELFEAGILVKSGENPRGTPAFKDLVSDPPATEEEFRGLWKLYCLSLIGAVLRDFKVAGEEAAKVISYLEAAELLPPGGTLAALIRRSLDYVRKFVRLESVEGGLKLDPATGLPAGFTGKITLREPAAVESKAGWESLDSLLALANAALRKANYKLWILLDRLDVAFADSAELETNALRALFKAYLDLSGLDNVRLKIFLRSDIWKRITESGFREGSHIIRHATITWTEPFLLNLVIRRVLSNKAIREFYGVSEEEVLSNYAAQVGFFYRLFPDKVDPGQKKPKTFDWMLSRTRDGLGIPAPRELIHLLNSIQEVQIGKYDLGAPEPSHSYLFDRICFKEAMREVSRVRVEQTIYAEYPEVKPWIEAIEGEKTEQSIESLAELWNVNKQEAATRAQRLVDIGFFEALGKRDSPRFKVPFLYRNYLALLQGKADQPGYTDEDPEEALFTLDR
ncbi:MAG: P-loop ATPase, Sll1717 family [Candidatus Udaeobacter sp.]